MAETNAKSRTLILRDAAYFKAVESAQRMEILTSLGDAGPASIAELALRLGRTPHSLYHHMRLLLAAKIIRAERKGKKKKEAVYELTASRIFVGPDSKSKASLHAAAKTLDSVLRWTSREASHAMQSGAKLRGAEREIYGIRLKARMSPSALRQLNHHLDQIEVILRKASSHPASGKEKLFALTLVLTPCLPKTK
jgi:DNA-binding transcriptional ArsR family regulator